jgi:hypothetical protein
MTTQERQELENLRAENAKLKAKKTPKPRTLSFKVGKAGGVSVYGLGRFPVTLYSGQWTRLMAIGADLAQFITDNQAEMDAIIEAKESAKS